MKRDEGVGSPGETREGSAGSVAFEYGCSSEAVATFLEIEVKSAA